MSNQEYSTQHVAEVPADDIGVVKDQDHAQMDGDHQANILPDEGHQEQPASPDEASL